MQTTPGARRSLIGAHQQSRYPTLGPRKFGRRPAFPLLEHERQEHPGLSPLVPEGTHGLSYGGCFLWVAARWHSTHTFFGCIR
jgi:hypothetical protein